jgi:hypothetical protein
VLLVRGVGGVEPPELGEPFDELAVTERDQAIVVGALDDLRRAEDGGLVGPFGVGDTSKASTYRGTAG